METTPAWDPEGRKFIYVTGHGWHTGIVVPAQWIPTGVWPESRNFNYEHMEVGWGDEAFYRARKVTWWITLKAVFWPTESVLHIAGFNGSVAACFPGSKIYRIDLSDAGFNALCRFIGNAHERKEDGPALSLGPGIYGHSRFYRAHEKYYFPKTCNTWTARALRQAGCPVKPATAVRAQNVLDQVAQFGTIIHSP